MTCSVKEILKLLEAIVSRGYSPRNVFDDWLSLMLYALLRNDKEYMAVVNRYRNDRPQGEREIDRFCEAFGVLQTKIIEEKKDILGEAYMQWEIQNKYNGQFFTPWHVASMMAAITQPQGESINDPACGSGVMLLAAAKSMTQEQIDKAVFVGQDIDFSCVKMCALNLTLFNLNGYVILGNTLLGEKRKVFRTIRSAAGGRIVEVDLSDVQTEEIRKAA